MTGGRASARAREFEAALRGFMRVTDCLMLGGRMNGFLGPVVLDLRPSPWLRRALLTVHALAAAALLFGYPASWPRNLLLAAMATHLPWSLGAARRLDIARLELDVQGAWRVVCRDGRVLDARLVSAPWLSPLFTTLEFACADGVARQLVLLPDMVDSDAFRRLRVRVRRAQSAAPGA